MEQAIGFGPQRDLRGIVHLPDGAVRAGVVFVHGWSGDRTGPHRMFVHAARRFAAEGFACLRFDLRGRGESAGDPVATDLDEMIADTLAAVECLAREAQVERVYVLGICSGGNVALGAASLRKDLGGLVLWSTPLFAPFRSGATEAARRGRLFGEYLRKVFRRETWSKLFRGGLRWRIIVRNLVGRERGAPDGRNPKDSRRDIVADLSGYRGPMIFIYGSCDEDAVGAPEFFRQWCEREGVLAEFHTIEGANHSYYSREWEDEVIGLSLEWLRRQSGGGGQVGCERCDTRIEEGGRGGI